MIDWLSQVDLALFQFLNSACANAVTDLVMPQITSDWNLRIGYATVMLMVLWKGPKGRRWQVIGSILVLAASDLIASSVFKPLFERPRPCQTLTDVHLLVNCGAGFSMPSSHAANAFGQLAFWVTFAPRLKWTLFVVAFLVAVSRVFVGVHYPGDVLVGSLVGGVIGCLSAILLQRLLNRKRFLE
jgi:undecaprenyl-diphosphatase